MAAYRRVYDSRHLQADCQGPGSFPELYARQSMIVVELYAVKVSRIVVPNNSKKKDVAGYF